MKLTTNESHIDRIIRIVLGIGLAGLALAGGVAAPLLYVVWLVAALLVVAGIVGFCTACRSSSTTSSAGRPSRSRGAWTPGCPPRNNACGGAG